jgi:hypothetical protein
MEAFAAVTGQPKPIKLSNLMFQKTDLLIEELRKRPGWYDFHREAGKRGFFFDYPGKDGRRYKWTAFTSKRTATGGWSPEFLAEGEGKTPLEAMDQAYRKSGRCDAEMDALWQRVVDGSVKTAPEAIKAPVVEDATDDFDALFEDEPESGDSATRDDEFEELFG